MTATRTILCNSVLMALLVTLLGCGDQGESESPKKTQSSPKATSRNRECIRVINDYMDAVQKQDVKNAMTLTVGEAARIAPTSCAFCKAYNRKYVLPVQTELLKEEDGVSVYKVRPNPTEDDGSEEKVTIVVLKAVKGQYYIIRMLDPEDLASALDPEKLEDVSRLDITEALEQYHQAAERFTARRKRFEK